MRLVYMNPNSTQSMTQSIVEVARLEAPQIDIVGLTNVDGPAAIQGPEDGDLAVVGLMRLLDEARDLKADAIVIACFDDTGLDALRARAHCPVLGIGQSAYATAQLLGARFSVVTSLAVSVPVIEHNIKSTGFGPNCTSVRASGLPVLEIDAGGQDVLQRLSDEIDAAVTDDAAQAVVLGCAGMAPLRDALAANSTVALIDGVAASVHLAQVAARFA